METKYKLDETTEQQQKKKSDDHDLRLEAQFSKKC